MMCVIALVFVSLAIAALVGITIAWFLMKATLVAAFLTLLVFVLWIGDFFE